MFVPHRKHFTSPLRAQQVNAINRFLTMVCQYKYHNSGHYPSPCLLFKIYDGLCLYLTGNMLRLLYEPNKLKRSMIHPSSCLLFKTQGG
jgi:hypothetical protein